MNKLQSYSDSNLLFIEDVFKKHTDLHGAIIASANSNHNKGIFEFLDGNSSPVYASAHKSGWHPHCVYIRLAYDLASPDLKLLQAAAEFLSKEFSKPLFFLLDDRFSSLRDVLKKQQFKMIRKTEVVHIRPNKHEKEIMNSLTTIAQISEDIDLMDSLVELFRRTYTETHMSNPVGDHSLESWREIAFDELLESHSYVVLKEKEVIAFSLMYEGDNNSWELGWTGVDGQENLPLLDVLLAQQLNDARQQGISYIEKEVDSTCPYSLQICKSVEYEVAETFFAYMNE
ncbi:hypothetical protein QWT69_10190 [Sporosarcina oncorhynchi]|uniref:GNAT family N-acetyltransferase n=1 Tax=Sporosarcina oncorhynchi TaxID=3056444 RepID=A0ABZ0L2B1_9BACL|nr:hypothetical protein [Sporosarcina sp. T2O-4]WOV86309.1 hypothetical protein QWT69_10190 [Sporosarcina sp. T2O-4]